MTGPARPFRILTWHVHGNYLFYLSQTPHQFVLPVGRSEPGYAGRAPGFPWPETVQEIPAEDVMDTDVDLVLFQSRRNYLMDQVVILSDRHRSVPRVYLEHDPPQEHPTNTRHLVDDPDGLVVHVTAFNDLMWDCGRTPTRVIEHGVPTADGVAYSGELAKGLVVVNGLGRRGRRLGADVFERVRREVPLDVIGMESEGLGGLGEISHGALPAFLARYRFLFNPIRYTSLGLAVCEAMTVGMPVIGLATTEVATVVENGVSGYVDTNVDTLIRRMHELLERPDLAARLGRGAQDTARRRFGLARFARQWDAAFTDMILRPGRRAPSRPGWTTVTTAEASIGG